MRKLKKRMLAFITIFAMGIQCCLPMLQSLANENEAVDVNVVPRSVIDIVLAKSKTKVDVSNFETDLKNELIKQNISPDRVKINAVEAVEANIQDSFDWSTDVSLTIGSFQITNQGQNIVMKGNRRYPGKNAIWIIPEKEQEQEIQFDYSVDFGDSFNAAGMLLRVKQEGNTLTGYMLSLNKSGKDWYKTAGKKYGAIWKFNYKIGNNTANMTKTFVKGLDINTSGTLNIKSTDTEIIISGGGLKSPINYTMDTEYGYGFGFFSDHYSHNCSKIGAFTLGNIHLTTTTVKKFKEVLSNPEWRENSLRFLVNVDDTENEELKDKTEFASLETRLINEQINPIFWGTDTNQKQAEEVIQSNNENGTFVNNTDYEKAIKETVEYIKSLIDSTESSQFAIVNEPVDLKVTPESAKTNTISEDYPQGKWKINHDCEYFENNLGQFEESGKYMSDLTLDFDKTGRYEVLYEDGKIASKYIYVHRRPVADFSVLQMGNDVTLTSQSYDLDCYSKNNGIAEEEWQYKKVGENDWTTGKLENIEEDDVYIIQLRVKDFQETWSAPTTKYVMYGNSETESIPIASFNFKNTTISKYEPLEVENSSYDPAGLELVDEVWTVKKNGNAIYTGKTPLTDYTSYETGTYTMSLIVTNQAGKSSEEFSRTFHLTGDTIVPEAAATPTSSDWTWTNQKVNVNLKFSDKGGSKFKGYQYAITNSEETPTAWSEMILKENDFITIDTQGEKYLHVIGYDNAGNISKDKVFGPYKIDLEKPQIDKIVPENKDWTNEAINISATFSDKGGSGFLGYKYAITASQTTPETWSEVIKESTGKFTISGEAEQYLHIVMYDNAGNESPENVYGPYQIDKISPKVEATPSFSDWTNQPVTVDLEFSDEGGSHLQKYQYAITDSGIMPEKWKDEIAGEPQTVVIDTEGEHYLHVVAYDNAGNDSSDFIFGKYKLDLTLPELVNDNEVNSDTEFLSIKFTATDKVSGVSKFIVNGTEVDGTEFIATSNGDYMFEILDYAGNKFTKELTIQNLYSECNKGLGHPTYKAPHEKCPVCELIEGIKVKGEEETYQAKPLAISYENAKNAEVIEYYDDKKEKPVKAGEYNYELKVIFNGTEYDTGIKGIFTIHKKAIDITGLKLEDKIDDGKTEVKVDKSNVKMDGIEEKDKDYIELKVRDKINYDTTSVGEKSVVFERDKDYRLELEEGVDESYKGLIDCYELPETLTLTGKLLAKETSTTDKSTNDADYSKNVNSNKTEEANDADKKDISRTVKDKVSGILAYTGGRVETSILIAVCAIGMLSIVSRKVLLQRKSNKKREPRMLEKIMKE